MPIDPNVLTVDGLALSGEHYKKSFILTLKNAEYTENENGERIFKVNGSFILRNQGHGGRYWENFFVSKSVKLSVQVDNENGEITTVFEHGGGGANIGIDPKVSSRNPYPMSQNFNFEVRGIEKLPDNTMTVKVILRGDNSGASNVITVTRNLISNLSEETILKRELEKQRIQNEIDRKETARLLELENQKIIIPKIIPTITPEILPSIVATSSLLPLGIIALLLYSRTGRK